ncbi:MULTISPECIES: hypothetical protein [Streptomyces]|uniref:Integral membrane protein n=1 Tax=Streptomyces solicathayae TaxID=3081768 RepID=A0ABZ0LNN1_9ACTN|nr:hypothetical protein [Streptomyces sp. HUAS YS2]WOX21084.1 hypothetical protein R2D22_06655 [Streptomyces sp. HUAS YS2]
MHTDAALVLFSAGVLLLAAMLLGVWKWRAMVASPDGRAHRYVDVAHQAALMYTFATTLIAGLVQFSAWPLAVNLSAATVVVFLFSGAIARYTWLGLRKETVNQMRAAPRGTNNVMYVLAVGEIGGVGVLLAGFAAAQL